MTWVAKKKLEGEGKKALKKVSTKKKRKESSNFLKRKYNEMKDWWNDD